MKLHRSSLFLAAALSLVLQSLPQTSLAAPQMNQEDRNELVQQKSAQWMAESKHAGDLLKAGKLNEAEAIYQKMLKEREALGLDLANERSGLASIYARQGKNDLAEAQYKALLAQREKDAGGTDDPTVAWVLNQYGDFLTKSGRKEEAQKLKARAKIAENPPVKPIATAKSQTAKEAAAQWRAQGLQFLDRTDPQKALTCFNKAIALDPHDAVAICGRGEAYDFLDRSAKALLDYNSALKLDPKNSRAFFVRGMWYEAKNDNVKALADFSSALANDPENTELLGYRAKLLDSIGRHKEAIADYSRVLELDPLVRWARIQRAVAFEGMKSYEKAISDFDNLLKRYPDDGDYYEYRGAALLKAGQFEKALSDYNRVVALKPKYAGGYLGRALTYTKIDGTKSARAKADYASARKLGWVDSKK